MSKGRKPIQFDKEACLRDYAKYGLAYQAAAAGGASYEYVRTLRTPRIQDRNNPGELVDSKNYDPEFAVAYDAAFEVYKESLRKEAIRRGVHGWTEREIHDKDGNVVGHVQKFSDRLLEMMLKRNDPLVRDRVEVDQRVSGAVANTFEVVPADLESLDREGRDAMRLVMKQLSEAKRVKVETEGDGAGRPDDETVH